MPVAKNLCSFRALAACPQAARIMAKSIVTRYARRTPQKFPCSLRSDRGGPMIPARRFAQAVTAWLPIASACVVLLSAVDARAQGARCEDAAEVAVMASPIAPWKG